MNEDKLIMTSLLKILKDKKFISQDTYKQTMKKIEKIDIEKNQEPKEDQLK